MVHDCGKKVFNPSLHHVRTLLFMNSYCVYLSWYGFRVGIRKLNMDEDFDDIELGDMCQSASSLTSLTQVASNEEKEHLLCKVD